jgi:hypothetical protein
MAFDPAAHPRLSDMGGRLRELAGDAAFKAGRDYLKKGLVKQGVVAGTTAFATVSGSTDYRVSVAFGPEEKVTCSCPAHRRSKFCKHVVAVASALLEQPAAFGEAEPAPEAPAAPKKTGGPKRAKAKSAAEETAENRTTGLGIIDKLLEELTAGGLVTLGAEQAALLGSAGELVEKLKLRRLGNAIQRLQRAATSGPSGLEPGDFARLLADIWLTRTAVGAHLEGSVHLDPALAEELLGKTWRESDLEPAAGLEVIEVASTAENDGKFLIETGFLADLATGKLFVEKAITPVQMANKARAPYRHRLVVDEAGLYPGPAPRRIRLSRARRAPLTPADVERFLDRATTDSLADLRRRLTERLANPFGSAQLAVAFRPAALLRQATLLGALDSAGRFLRLTLPEGWAADLADLLPEPGRYALVGLVDDQGQGLELQVLSVVSPDLAWGRGPVYPDGPARRR